jgi:hypothetical protein
VGWIQLREYYEHGRQILLAICPANSDRNTCESHTDGNSCSDIYAHSYPNSNTDSDTNRVYREMFTDPEAASDVIGATYSASSFNTAS